LTENLWNSSIAIFVACELQPVTCGLAVNKPVDKRRYVRITDCLLWILCG
jgi:hypothetical protein